MFVHAPNQWPNIIKVAGAVIAIADGAKLIAHRPESLIFIAVFPLGIQFVDLTMKVFGSLVTLMITSVWKALTVCLSFKVFALWHGVSLIAIAAGMSINVYEKTGKKGRQNEEEVKLLGNSEERHPIMDSSDS
jgi:adenosine 3'-phospho 5'-phosphosulfate transporter B3